MALVARPFAEGYLNVHGKNGIPFIRHLYEGFAPTLMEHGMSTISEIYDGDPPHRAEGAISQAWSVAEILRINYLINKFNKQKSSVNTEL
ncbi:MAG: hypothetical protein IPJ66_09005 [Bacteroidetes bacterium]|nr:hypothetical protein [Bacteroidota bacterium]